MIASPACRCSATPCTVDSVIAPAGTMIQTVRGPVSLAARSAYESAPVAPSATSAATASGLTS